MKWKGEETSPCDGPTTRPAQIRDPRTRDAAALITDAAFPAAIIRRGGTGLSLDEPAKLEASRDAPLSCAVAVKARSTSAVNARSSKRLAEAAPIPARTIARTSCRSSESERVSGSVWDPTRPKG